MARAGNKPKPPVTPRIARREYDREALVPEICKRLATGEPLSVILRDEDIPRRTVDQWRGDYPDIAVQFDEARDLGFDAIAADCLAIADDGSNDYKPGERGGVVFDAEAVQRSKLRVDTRLKLLAKWDPRRYGDKVQLADADGNNLPAPVINIYPTAAK